MQTHVRSSEPGIAGGWLLLALDGLRLALPQREVVLITLMDDLTAAGRDDADEIGMLLRPQGPSWPVFGLDGVLGLERRPSETRRSCVFFGSGGEMRGLACDHLWSLASDADLSVAPVPGCLRAVRSPITGFARYRDGLVAVTHASELVAYLDYLTEHGHGQRE